MHNYKNLILALALGAASSGAVAQQQADAISEYRGLWGVSLESISLNPDVAAANGIADSGYGLGVSYSGEKGLFNFTIGGSLFLIDDEATFRQDVENELTGDESTEKSSIDAGSLYIDGGIQYPGEKFSLGLNAGYRYFDIDRGITNCRDCYNEDIKIESDTYLKPFARMAFTETVSGTLAYFNYMGDKGAENSVQFEVKMGF